MSDLLEGVVAVVLSCSATYTAKAPIERMLEKLGARVVKRLTKDVTHVVYERRAAQRPADQREAEVELLDLYSKVDRLDPRPAIVSPSWVEESRKAKKRLVERAFVISRPKEALLLAKPGGRTPGSGPGAGRKRKQAAPPPKPQSAFDMGELFTSSQQIRGEGRGAGNIAADEVTSPRAGGGGGGGRGAGGAARKRAAAGGSGGRAAKAARPSGGAAERSSPCGLGTDTQAAADIMVDLLPGGQADTTPGLHVELPEDRDWEEEDDDLDTPLELRLAKSTSRSASKERDRRHSGPAGRSRLAHASGPRAREGEEAAADEGLQAASPWDGEAPAAAAPAGAKPAEGGAKPSSHGRGGVQPAQRYSVRQLAKMEEKPIVLHKGTPLPGALPPPTGEKRPKSGIPIPAVERVKSPWQEAEQLPLQSQSQQSGQAAAAGRESEAGEPAAEQPQGRKQPQPPSHNRRALLHDAVRNASPASSFKPPAPAAGNAAPWSAHRPWDQRTKQPGSAGKEGAAAAAEGGTGVNGAPAAVQRRVLHERQGEQDVGGSGRGSRGEGGKPAKHKQVAATAEAQQQQRRRGRQHGADLDTAAKQQPGEAQQGAGDEGEEEGDAEGHLQQGYIAVTSVDPGVLDLCKSAVRRLRGLRLCSEGHEDGKITHLVIGKERRTLKLMLAVANGAWLVGPDWVTASLEAGRWLPESQYLAKARFVAAAERARCALEVPDMPALLHDHSIYFHLSDSARKAQAGNLAALKRVALALGAKVVAPKACTVCVVVGSGGRPTHIPKQTAAVREEWLLMAAERFDVPSTSSREFTLR